MDFGREDLLNWLYIYTLTEKYYKASENNDFLVGVYLDLTRAFDTISHDILLKKLSFYGFRGKSHDWIENYLSGRRRYTCVL